MLECEAGIATSWYSKKYLALCKALNAGCERQRSKLLALADGEPDCKGLCVRSRLDTCSQETALSCVCGLVAPFNCHRCYNPFMRAIDNSDAISCICRTQYHDVFLCVHKYVIESCALSEYLKETIYFKNNLVYMFTLYMFYQ